MLKKIGMTNNSDIAIYLEHLENLYGKMVSFPSQKSYSGIYWKYSVSACIELIKQEIDLKQSINSIEFCLPKSTFSATDLSNYEYCPASFVINNSFKIEKPSGVEFTEIGKEFHNKLLATRTTWYEKKNIDFSSIDLDVKKVRDSRLIFAGHQEDDKKFNNENWVGIPDYIFQDLENNYFVVEEKFHYKKDPEDIYVYDEYTAEEAEKEQKAWSNYKAYFFSNHIVQIVSYIKNIKEYSLKYGYLLYWYYDIKNDEPYIHKVLAKRINLNEQTEELYSNTVNGIKQLGTNTETLFQIDKLNMKKCAGCVVNKYCGHKTKRFEMLTFPYNLNFLNLFYAKFPDELKKSNM
nr:hypothetical protein [Pseudopedobacter sp.]